MKSIVQGAIISALILLGSGPAPAQSPPPDHFRYDPARAQRAGRYQQDMDKMSTCVAELTPQFMPMGSRSRIKDMVGGACLSDIVADGFMDLATGKRIVAHMIDQEIDALLPAGR